MRPAVYVPPSICTHLEEIAEKIASKCECFGYANYAAYIAAALQDAYVAGQQAAVRAPSVTPPQPEEEE